MNSEKIRKKEGEGEEGGREEGGKEEGKREGGKEGTQTNKKEQVGTNEIKNKALKEDKQVEIWFF